MSVAAFDAFKNHKRKAIYVETFPKRRILQFDFWLSQMTTADIDVDLSVSEYLSLYGQSIRSMDSESTAEGKGKELEGKVSKQLRAMTFYSLHSNVILGWEDQPSPKAREKNQVDFIGTKNCQLYIFECKAGTLNQSDIAKLKTLNDLAGGTFGKAYLIANEIPPEIEARAKELRITTISGKDVDNLNSCIRIT